MNTLYKSDGEMFDTPAAVDRDSATMYINPKLWFGLTKFQRKFVKLHELGHYELNTDIEEEADAYAFDRLAGTQPRSMKQCIETLETILDPNKAGHQSRIEALTQRAVAWDETHPIKKPILNKASGKNHTTTDPTQAAVQILQASYQGTNQVLSTVEEKETKADNNRTMVYCMLAIAALFLLKD